MGNGTTPAPASATAGAMSGAQGLDRHKDLLAELIR